MFPRTWVVGAQIEGWFVSKAAESAGSLEIGGADGIGSCLLKNLIKTLLLLRPFKLPNCLRIALYHQLPLVFKGWATVGQQLHSRRR